MSEIKLLPCPFCGYDYAQIEHDKEGFVYVQCHKSGCMARTDGCLNENEASRLWNTRKPMERIIERLEDEANICRDAFDTSGDNFICGEMNGFVRGIYIVKEEGGIDA